MAFRQLLEAQVKVISHFSSFPTLVPALHLTTITYVTVARPDHHYRGPQFASAFLQALNKALERTIQSLKQYLRIYCYDRQKRWARWLPLAEFAYNLSPHSVTKRSPMFSLYGFEPCGIQVNNDSKMASPTAEDWLY